MNPEKTIMFTKMFIILCLIGSSCSILNPSDWQFSQKFSYAETVFEATIPEPLGSYETLFLEIVDEITGIALNPTRFEMEEKDDYSFFIRIPLSIGSNVQYRYIKTGEGVQIEHTSLGEPIQYRIYQVLAPEVVSDYISGWSADSFIVANGEISGYIFDKQTEAPIPEVLVSFNGMRTFTSVNGFYQFQFVPSGEYHLTAVHPDGKYQTFQQKAVISENSITPASFGMEPAKMVDIIFIVTPPEESIPGAPIRLLGNLKSLGNTFSELSGGASVMSSHAPSLHFRDDGKYELSIKLPEGFHLKYKYSLGDGFVNAEHAENGDFRVRDLIVPKNKTTVRETIDTWYSGQQFSITFNVTVPDNTPTTDAVSIQFNPFLWMEPIPMWQVDDQTRLFTLYSPMNYMNQAQYRFCRNEQCGKSDDAVTAGINPLGYFLELGEARSEIINYEINTWYGLEDILYNIQPVNFNNTSHIKIKGFELDAHYDKHWLPYIDGGLIDAGVSGANIILLTSSWSFTNSPMQLAIFDPGKDPYLSDLAKIIKLTNEAGIQAALYPQPGLEPSPSTYWSQAELTYLWWQNWFKDYEEFIINFTDFAEVNNLPLLVIGGQNTTPAFPNGRLYNGSPSNTPFDVTDRWNTLFDQIRSRYHGQIGFAIPYSSNLDNTPDFIQKADFIYMEMESAVSASNNPSKDEIEGQMEKILDEEIYKLYAVFQKPIIIGINYYSVDGSASNCVNYGNSCNDIMRNSPEIFSPDMLEQADTYQGILSAAVTRPWISGLISKGYNPGVAVQDLSSSTRGKPAMQVLSYFYNQINQ